MEFQLDDSLLFKGFLNEKLFNNKINKLNNPNASDIVAKEGLELIIRPECNQKCDYCYIGQYGDKLYPYQERANNSQILNNLKMFLNYLIKEESYIVHWEIFAGDLFYDDLYFDLMDVFYNYYFNKLHEMNKIIPCQVRPRIVMPCNFSFCESKEQLEKIEKIIDKFENINVELGFSWSHDGKYAIDTREKREISEEFYDNAFNFVKKHRAGIHAMISAENIENAIENFDWWVSAYNKYLPDYDIVAPYFLEVRNGGEYWTDEKIDKYLEFLNHVMNKMFNLCDRDPKKYCWSVYSERYSDRKKEYYKKYYPHIKIAQDFTEIIHMLKNPDAMSCTHGHALCLNIGNLTFNPCHRLTYKQFQGGCFKVNQTELFKTNNQYLDSVVTTKEIVDIEAKDGLNGYLNSFFTVRNNFAGCNFCEYNGLCIKGCLGAQFEHYGDPNYPIPSVCKLYKSKIDFIFKKYKEFDALNFLIFSEESPLSEFKQEKFKEFLDLKGWYNE